MNLRRYFRCLAPLVLVWLAAGCLQVEVHIEMQDDGPALVTERVRFSRRLLELDASIDGEAGIADFVERSHIDRRVKEMGEGAEVVSHEIDRREDGSIEAKTVYRIPDIEDLRLVNPWLAHGRAGRVMRIRFSPIYQRVHSFHRVGDLMMAIVPAEDAEQPEGEFTPALTPRNPAELQMLRDLQPIFADLLSDAEFSIRLTYPDDSEHDGKRTLALLSFKGSDIDAHGRPFRENEEVMLRILQMDFGADIIRDHVRAGGGEPVFRGRWHAAQRFRIPPTTHLFNRYFKGRPRSQGGDQPG